MRTQKHTRFVPLLLVVLIAAMALFTGCEEAKTQAGSKTITVEIIVEGKETVTKTIATEAEFLRGALDEEEGLVVGEEGPYGLYIQVVDGESAIYEENGAYWAFYENGAYANTGIDLTPITDGQNYSLVYTVG